MEAMPWSGATGWCGGAAATEGVEDGTPMEGDRRVVSVLTEPAIEAGTEGDSVSECVADSLFRGAALGRHHGVSGAARLRVDELAEVDERGGPPVEDAVAGRGVGVVHRAGQSGTAGAAG